LRVAIDFRGIALIHGLLVPLKSNRNVDGHYARDDARLILVFRPPKTASLLPRIRGLEHYYLNYKRIYLYINKYLSFSIPLEY
jgi:hypothetical protein